MRHVSLLAVLLLGASTAVSAEPLQNDELNWLKTMSSAVRTTSYSGIFVYQNGTHVETSRITHVVGSDGEHGRLEALDGARREVIRNNGEVWCYVGDRKVRMEERQGRGGFPALLPEQLNLLHENYQVRRAEDDRVAGFQARTLLFKSRDNLRYSHKMWAHSDSALLLKAQVLDERGKPIEQYAFIQLAIGGNNIDRSWIPADPGSVSKLHPSSGRKAEITPPPSGWQIDMMPAGFRKVAEVRRPMQGKKEPVTQLVFSDGLVGISIFIEKSRGGDSEPTGLSGQGLIQIYSKQMADHLVTVVGEVPPRTVMQVADSVRFAGNR